MTVKVMMVILILCGCAGMAMRGVRRLIKSLKFYTPLSNLTAIVSAFLFLLTDGASWVSYLRYMAVCLLIMTCLVTVFVLVPTIKDTHLLLWSRVGFLLHLLCPFLNTVSYLFLEPHAGASAIIVPAIATFVYGVIMLYLNYINKMDGPYPFLRVHHQSAMATVMWIAVLLILISSIGAGVWYLSSLI